MHLGITPHWENTFIYRLLLANPKSQFPALEELFELTLRPSRALNAYVASETEEKQGHCQVWRAKYRAPPETNNELSKTFVN